MKSLKEKLTSQKHLSGTNVTLTDASIGEIFGYLGFDFIWIDTEHSTIDYQTLNLMIMGVKAAGTSPLVRVPWQDPTATKKVLEMGAEGILFPMVNTAEEADAAMRQCLYPPLGDRGFGPRRAVRYGIDDVREYVYEKSLSICRFIQIESEQAIRNLPEIVKNPYIDGYIFGPNDLSASIGEFGNVYGEKTGALIDEAVAILKPTGKTIGVSVDATEAEKLKYWHDKGIGMITSGQDCGYLVRGAKATLANLRAVQGGGQPS